MTGPLSGVRVLELGGKGPVPFAGMVLADLGAEVFVLERIGATAHPDALVVGRGKFHVRVDLKSDAVREALIGAVQSIDVVIEGFRPGVAERLGLGPDVLRDAHPPLVYGRMSGYGQEGAYSRRPGHDLNFLAMSSALAHLGPPGAPPPPPLTLVGDFGGGGMLLVVGVLAALLERSRSGEGQVLDAAMVDGAALLMASVYGTRAAGQWSDARGSNTVDGGAPFYRSYETADGRYVAVGALDPHHYDELLRVCGIDESSAPRQDDRSRWAELGERLEAVFRSRDQAHWVGAFSDAETSFAPVLTMQDAPGHPHHVERGTFVSLDGVVQPAAAPRFSRTPAAARPPLAAVPAEVLARLGVPDERARAMIESGAVA